MALSIVDRYKQALIEDAVAKKWGDAAYPKSQVIKRFEGWKASKRGKKPGRGRPIKAPDGYRSWDHIAAFFDAKMLARIDAAMVGIDTQIATDRLMARARDRDPVAGLSIWNCVVGR